MQLYVVDTETFSLNSPIVLIQHQLIDTKGNNQNDTKIVLHDVWGVSIQSTLDLIAEICDKGIIAFNLVFDWYHLQRLYNTLDELGKVVGYDAHPEDHIEQYAQLEMKARDSLCVKPRHCLDLFLYARKGPYQSLSMNRSNIVIKRIPTVLISSLQKRLDEIIDIEAVYFARRKVHKEYNWDIEPCDDPTFSDLTLRFKPSIALKVLAQHILGIDETLARDDVFPTLFPLDLGYSPCAVSLCPDGPAVNWRCKIPSANGYKKGYAWPHIANNHIAHWRFHKLARQYARDDITYTRDMFYHFRDEESSTLQVDDDDSILAAQVGSARWRGFDINEQGIKSLRNKEVLESMKAPKAPSRVWDYISPYLSAPEQKVLNGSTKATVLEALAEGKEPCMECLGEGRIDPPSKVNPYKFPGIAELASLGTMFADIEDGPQIMHDLESRIECPACKGTGNTGQDHPAAKYAQQCLDARQAAKKVEMWDKLLLAKRFHASFKIIGTFTSRMAGADKLNPQGIEHSKESRSQFPLSFGDLVLSGGDFMSFEVSINDAICDDENLRTELCRCAECKYVWTLEEFATQIDCPNCGKRDEDGIEPCRQKFHGLFGMALKPGSSYDDVIASKGTDDDLYDKGKRGGFSQLYGGNYSTLMTRLGVSEEVALDAVEWFDTEFPGTKKFRDDIENDFCSMKQKEGIGTKVIWNDPKEYVESLLGHRRYFTLENKICKKLFGLANNLPPNWKEVKGICVRREREQTNAGAMMSALYAAAFNIQSKNLRAAANHIIQSTGAQITKDLQCKLWKLQPVGIHPWSIQILNVHDELMTCIVSKLKPKAREIVDELVQQYRPVVPLIAIGWNSNMETWADK